MHLEDFLKVSVIGGKAMMWRSGAREQQAHWVALIPKRGLNTNKDIAELTSKHQQLGAIGVQISCTILSN